RHPRDGGHRLCDDPQSAGDHGGRIRRLSKQTHQHKGFRPGRPADARAPPRRRRTSVSTPARVLVVDDTPLNIKLLADLLTARGYAVLTAEPGPAALKVIDANQPDLVPLDVVMRAVTRHEVCRRGLASR